MTNLGLILIMTNWLTLNKEEQTNLFIQVSLQTGLPPFAIEKDAWVTLALRMLFGSKLNPHIVFKGGTSLSKCYGLIKRFSEDIDFSIDREYLGFTGNLTKGEIRKLRRASHDFTKDELPKILSKSLTDYGIDAKHYKIEVPNVEISDQDPEILLINYDSVFDEETYLTSRVQIEIGARSLIEPFQVIEINSLIDSIYHSEKFTEQSFKVNAVVPAKTFIEKVILLHEEFKKPVNKIKYEKMSRHLYDIAQIIDTDYFDEAMNNVKLFKNICKHRAKFTPVKPVGTIDYGKLTFGKLKIIPPNNVFDLYRDDYKEMRESMIYGDSPDFDTLITKLKTITKR